MSDVSHSLMYLPHYLEPAIWHASRVLEGLPEENTHDHWRLFKLISDMKDILNNPPKV